MPEEKPFIVELILWAKGLANLDKFSKSDPLCVVEKSSNLEDGQRKGEEWDWAECGRTEAVMNNLNPKWNKKIRLEVKPTEEKKQKLRFKCYDIDSAKEALTFHDFLGRCQCQLADILDAPNGTHKLRLKKDTGAFAKGWLLVHAEKIGQQQEAAEDGWKEPVVHFHIRGLFTSPAKKLGQHGVTNIVASAPSIYLEFYRLESAEEKVGEDSLMVHRVERVKNSWYPAWEQFDVPFRLISHGDKRRKFLVQCIDKEANESNKLIGAIRTTIEELTEGHRWRLELMDEDGGEEDKLYILAVLMYLSVIFAQQKRSHRFYLPYLIVMAIGLIGLALYILVYIGIFIVGPESMMGIDNPELKMHLRLFFGIVLIPLLIIFTFNIWFYLVIYKAYKYLKDAPAAVHYPNPNA